MRLIRTIDLKPDADSDYEPGNDGEGGETPGRRYWHWYELQRAGDSDGSRSNEKPVLWQVHTDDVTENTRRFVAKLPLSDELKRILVTVAEWHDLGKRRPLFQRILGNQNPNVLLAKSGKKNGSTGLPESFRHEFGSLVDLLDERQPYYAEFKKLSDDMKEVALHLIAVHHGRGRPHFPRGEAFDPIATSQASAEIAAEVPRRFTRLQRKYGRWGLAYLESLLRAADYAASANPSKFVEEER